AICEAEAFVNGSVIRNQTPGFTRAIDNRSGHVPRREHPDRPIFGGIDSTAAGTATFDAGGLDGKESVTS
ncbi:MAG: hypothetical protein WCG62_06590, partial [Actinomycetes bacterium]